MTRNVVGLLLGQFGTLQRRPLQGPLGSSSLSLWPPKPSVRVPAEPVGFELPLPPKFRLPGPAPAVAPLPRSGFSEVAEQLTRAVRPADSSAAARIARGGVKGSGTPRNAGASQNDHPPGAISPGLGRMGSLHCNFTQRRRGSAAPSRGSDRILALRASLPPRAMLANAREPQHPAHWPTPPPLPLETTTALTHPALPFARIHPISQIYSAFPKVGHSLSKIGRARCQ